VRRFFAPLLGYFLTPWGPLVLGALDASLIFFLPLAIDMVVIIMTARHRELFWLYPLLAAIGSVIGSAVTFAIGRWIGEVGLERFASARQLERLKCRVRDKGAVAMALPAIVPPPFPFTPFVLTCGALDVDRWKFFGTLFAVRLARFGAEAVLALVYGRAIIAWLQSDSMQIVIGVFLVIALGGTAWSIYRLLGARPPTGRAPTRGALATPKGASSRH
jgi:membrane protein YqaA with SNARE-associated domain